MLAQILFLIFLFIGMAFFFHQLNGPMGGKMSVAKGFWLFYAVFTWFVFLPLLLFYYKVPSFLDYVWGVFWVWMAIRGLVELFMMYITKNWTPPIGITHNISCVLWLIGSSIYFYIQVLTLPTIVLFFHISLIVSMILETWYAVGFYKIVKEKTKGDDAIWFAPSDDNRFKNLVLWTGAFNWPLFSILLIYLYRLDPFFE